MRHALVIAALIATLQPAHAEFVLVAPQTARERAHTATTPHPKRTRRPTIQRHAAEPILNGFGNQIPLAFALRQIVPERFHVAFANTVEQDAPVDWKGGKPWRPTLAEALRPLGLTASVTRATVAIAPSKPSP